MYSIQRERKTQKERKVFRKRVNTQTHTCRNGSCGRVPIRSAKVAKRADKKTPRQIMKTLTREDREWGAIPSWGVEFSL